MGPGRDDDKAGREGDQVLQILRLDVPGGQQRRHQIRNGDAANEHRGLDRIPPDAGEVAGDDAADAHVKAEIDRHGVIDSKEEERAKEKLLEDKQLRPEAEQAMEGTAQNEPEHIVKTQQSRDGDLAPVEFVRGRLHQPLHQHENEHEEA
ncbi:MAG: hypothetical protein ACYCXE_08325 [Thermoleophilia bacterium]